MKILDLDKDFNSLLQIIYEDDIRDISPRLYITTKVDEEYDFLKDQIIFNGSPFICHSIKRNPVLGGDGITAYCKIDGLHKTIDRVYQDSISLSRIVEHKFAKDSLNIKFTYPYLGMHFGSLLYRLRQDSFESNWNKLDQVLWLYVDGDGFHTSNLGTLIRQPPIPFTPENNFQTNYCIINDKNQSIYDDTDFPNYQKYTNFWNFIMTEKVEIQSTSYGAIGKAYNFKFGDPRINDQSYVLVYQKFDSKNRAQPWTLTFSKIVPSVNSNILSNKSSKTSNLKW